MDIAQRKRIEIQIENLIKDRTAAGCFYGVTVSFLVLVEDSSIKTAATDGIHLFYNPAYVALLTDAALRGLLAHEAEHCMRLHFLRMGSRDLELWNISGDHEINLELLAAKFELPPGALADKKYSGMAAESIYAAEFRAREKKEREQAGKPGPGAGAPQNGSGAPQNGKPDPGNTGAPGAGSPASGHGKPGNGQGNRAPDPGMCGGIIAPRDATGAAADKAEIAAKWQARARQAAAVAAKRAGTMPGSIQAILETVNNPPGDWRENLNRFVTDSIERESSWSRPDRRMISKGFYLPSQVNSGRGRIVWGIDVSGSIFGLGKTYSEFQKAAQMAMDSGAADSCTIVFCDTEIKAVSEFQAGEELKFHKCGGGGTRFSPVMDWVKENAPDAACLVYFTDMDCNDFGEEPGIPVLWLNWGNRATAPFGDVIPLDPHQ